MCRMSRLNRTALLLALAMCLALPGIGAAAKTLNRVSTSSAKGFSYAVYSDDTIAILGWEGYSVDKLFIPAELDGLPVTSINCGAFKGMHSLTEVSIAEGIVYIEVGAFEGCDNLTRVSIPASATGIWGNPFSNCVRLTDIIVAEDNPALELIDGVLFMKPSRRLICYPFGIGAESYEVPEGTRSIAERAFSLTPGVQTPLKRVVIPEGVVSLDESAFEDNQGLIEVSLPDSLVAIDEYAFSGCTGLETLKLSANISYSSVRAFNDVSAAFVVPPDSYALRYCICNELNYRIQDDEPWTEAVVANCEEWISLRAEPSTKAKKLAEIPLGARVWVEPAEDGFRRCSYLGLSGYALAEYLESAPGDEDVGEYYEQDSMLFEKLRDGTLKLEHVTDYEITSLVIPSEVEGMKVTVIGSGASGEHYDLETVDIPDSVTVIEGDAFYYCDSLRRVVMPSGPVLIMDNPFTCCAHLEEIVLASDHPTLKLIDGVLFNRQEERLLSYPCGAEPETYAIPQGTRSIAPLAFCMEGDFYRYLIHVALPEGLEVLEDSALGLSDIEFVNLPESLTVLGEYSCRAVDKLPASLLFIGKDPIRIEDPVLVQEDSYAFDWCVANGVACTLQGSEILAGEPAPAAKPDSGMRATVVRCDEWVSLRKAPSTGAERLVKIPLGAEVEVLASEGEFWQCRYQGQAGYVLAEYLEPVTEEAE